MPIPQAADSSTQNQRLTESDGSSQRVGLESSQSSGNRAANANQENSGEKLPDTSYIANVTESEALPTTELQQSNSQETIQSQQQDSNKITHINQNSQQRTTLNTTIASSVNRSSDNSPKQVDQMHASNSQTNDSVTNSQVQPELSSQSSNSAINTAIVTPKDTAENSGDDKSSTKQINDEPKRPTEDPNSQTVRIQLALANRYYNSGKYQNAIDLLETPSKNVKSDEKLRDLLLLSYSKYAGILASKAELLEAQTILEKAVMIQPENINLQNQLTKIKNEREAARQYDIGLEAINAGNKNKAYKSFQKVLELHPEHSLARKHVVRIQSSVIELRYKQGMQHYRNQELNEAIKAWDEVLELNPNHELAKLYRARAAELKRKIDEL